MGNCIEKRKGAKKRGLAIILIIFIVFSGKSSAKKNMVRNSSFEVGISGWAGGKVDTSTSVHGKNSLKADFSDSSPAGFMIESRFIKIKPNKEYTFSVYMKTSTAALVKISIYSGFDPGTYIWPGFSRTVIVTNEWQRFSVSGKIPESYADACFIKINRASPFEERNTLGFLWVDTAQLEKGSLSDYHPRKSVEVSSVFVNKDYPEVNDKIFVEGQKPLIKTVIYNEAKTSRKLEIEYCIFDYYDNEIEKITRYIDTEGKKHLTDFLEILPEKRGILRMEATVRDPAKGIEDTSELVFGISAKKVANRGFSGNSYFGTHILGRPTGIALDTASKIGVRWFRVFGAGVSTCWNEVEPQKGKFVWPLDKYMEGLQKHKLELLGTLTFTPAWASTVPDQFKNNRYKVRGYPPKNISDWENYVARTVEHYKGKIKYWEIWNEPGGMFYGTQKEFIKLVKSAYRVAKRVNPDCKIMVNYNEIPQTHSGYGDSFLGRKLLEFVIDYMDVFSYHSYVHKGRMVDSDEPTLTQKFAWLRRELKYKKMPLWNTEWGIWGRTFYHTFVDGSEVDSWRGSALPAREAANYFVQANIVSIANGVEKLFYYFIGYSGGGPIFSCTNRWPIMIDPDGSPMPMTMAQATLCDIIDGARFVKKVKIAEDTVCYIFKKDRESIGVIWGEYKKGQSKPLKIKSKQLSFIDIMDNEIKALEGKGYQTIYVKHEPMFIIAKGVSVDKLESILKAASPGGGMPEELTKQLQINNIGLFSRLCGQYKKDLNIALGVKCSLFEEEESIIAACWTTGENKDIKIMLPIRERNIRMYDIRGVPLSIDKKKKKLNIELTSEPTFIEWTKNTMQHVEEVFGNVRIKKIVPLTFITARVTSDGLSFFAKGNITAKTDNGCIRLVKCPEGMKLKSDKNLAVKSLLANEISVFNFPLAKVNSFGPSDAEVIFVENRKEVTRFKKRVGLIRCNKIKNPVNINGDLSDWNLRDGITINREDQVRVGNKEVWKGVDDLSARCYARWDDENLYLALEVKDDKVQTPNKASIFNNDCVELFFDTELKKDVVLSKKTGDDFQICLSPKAEPLQEDLIEKAIDLFDKDMVQVASRINPTGYNIEVKIPFHAFRKLWVGVPAVCLRPRVGYVIGFDVAIDDCDSGNRRKLQMVWTGTEDNWRDMTNFGSLMFYD